MRLRRGAPISTGRQRRASNDPQVPVRSTFSYGSKRSPVDVNTGRKLQREVLAKAKNKAGNNFWLQRFGLIILMIALLFSAVNILTLSNSAQVKLLSTEKSAALMRDKSEYEQAGTKLLAESIWNRNKVTVNTVRISQQLQAQFPELASTSVTVPLLAHRPLIYVEPYEPALVMVASNGSFVVSSTGKTLLRASKPTAFDNLRLPLVNDQSGLKLQLNHQALPANSVNFIQHVAAQLNAKQISIASMTLPSAASELDIQITGKPYIVKFNLHSSETARQQAGTYLATAAQLEKQAITPSKYIDVRVNGRAYYQ